MNRTKVWRPLLAALLVALSLANWTASTAAARLGDEGSAARVSLASGVTGEPSGGPSEGPGPRFGFSSVVGQLATSVSKVATSIDGAPVANPKSVTVRPGQLITFSITGQLEDADSPDVADIFDASLTYQFDTGECFPGTLADIGNPTLRPANIGGVLVCNPILFGLNASFSFDVIFQVNATGGPHSEANFNVACVEGTRAENVFNLCSAVAGTVQAPTSTPTPTASPTSTSTLTPTTTNTPTRTATPTTGVPPTPVPSGTQGQPCANTVGQICNAAGAVTGAWTKTSSGVFTFTATGPAGATVGGVPVLFIPTTDGDNNVG